MKEVLRNVLIFAIAVTGFVTYKGIKGVNSLLKPKPKVYVCAKCKEQILRGTGIRIGNHTICLQCLRKGCSIKWY